jgi:hypothetical protein
MLGLAERQLYESRAVDVRKPACYSGSPRCSPRTWRLVGEPSDQSPRTERAMAIICLSLSVSSRVFEIQ